MSNVNEVLRPAQFSIEDGSIPFVSRNTSEDSQNKNNEILAVDHDKTILDYDPENGRVRYADGLESTASRWNLPPECVPITGTFVTKQAVIVESDSNA